MPLHPEVYGRLLAERLAASGARVFLLNTGWTGGGYGTGRRIDIAATRRLLNAALSGALDNAPMRIDPVFGLAVPRAIEGVDPMLLEPRRTWADAEAYDAQAARLLGLFARNFQKFGDRAEMAPRLAAAE
jgi:phosphoenolpyruvate carboxykinase (ATP)